MTRTNDDLPRDEWPELEREFAYSQEAGPRLEMDFDLADLVVICHEALRDFLADAESYELEPEANAEADP